MPPLQLLQQLARPRLADFIVNPQKLRPIPRKQPPRRNLRRHLVGRFLPRLDKRHRTPQRQRQIIAPPLNREQRMQPPQFRNHLFARHNHLHPSTPTRALYTTCRHFFALFLPPPKNHTSAHTRPTPPSPPLFSLQRGEVSPRATFALRAIRRSPLCGRSIAAPATPQAQPLHIPNTPTHRSNCRATALTFSVSFTTSIPYKNERSKKMQKTSCEKIRIGIIIIFRKRTPMTRRGISASLIEEMSMLPRKQMIFDYVVNSHVHPTAQDVFDAVRVEMPNISLATVYRNLNELADAGEIMRIAVPGRPDRFDQLFEPHDHLVCLACGCIVDIPLISHRAIAPKGCIISYCKLTAYGYCSWCAAKQGLVPDQPKGE